ncbi:Glucan endo-1,3-beta-D-glucosidase [Heracleum sosnowskyi]|uniref:glucan endo-1,3-beta-D-glucosidase n=1 Tax=Heracleum sosnowskyi TaxID=360622 RepID=A0AAD8HFA5_9APIA|nr:Glucan endo-1,3-beta-D-glucosidase [Heracleum sosnowskyi]
MAILSAPVSLKFSSSRHSFPKRHRTLLPAPLTSRLPIFTCSASRDCSSSKEILSHFKELRNVACGVLAVWAVTTASPVDAANPRLPPLSTDPERCERAFVGNTIALMSDAKFDGADMTEVVMSKAYAVGASFKGVDFSNAVLDRVNFGKANLQGVSFRNTVLSGSTFDDAQLEDAIFEDTIIEYATMLHLHSRIFQSILLLLVSISIKGAKGIVGVNYGMVADNLPTPELVARFLQESTIINHVRIFDTDPDSLKAFANTGIAISVTIPNDQITSFTDFEFAQNWLVTNILPHLPDSNIVRILVGNEVLSTANTLMITNLVQAMDTIHTALVNESIDKQIKVTTPHSLGLLVTSSPPSAGKFRQGYDNHVIKPLLSFLRATDSPFLINPYPFLGCSNQTLDYALFRPHSQVLDEITNLTYTNMLDAQLDAVYSALKLIGFADINIVIAETGWPSKGDPGQVGLDVDSAAEYNKNLVQHVTSMVGTPLMPNRTFETYIFGLFNENLKPGPVNERNFGLFNPDFTPVYDIGILRPKIAASAASKHCHNTRYLFMMIVLYVTFVLAG